MTIDEIANEIEEHLEPSQVELAVAMFTNAVKRAPNTTHPLKLSRELFHGALSSSLTILIADKNTEAVPVAAELILDFPDETEIICTYLRAVATTSPDEVGDQISLVLEGEFLLGWQLAWLLNVLLEIVDSSEGEISEELLESINEIVDDEGSDWIARTTGARLLGRMEELDHASFLRLWGSAPPPLRSELADAICMQSEASPGGWESAFVDGIGADPILKTVITRARNRLVNRAAKR
jgi:hypothetical protein